MDAEGFTSTERGEIRKTLQGHYAFYPAPLPRTVELPAEAVTRLAGATAALYSLGGVGRLLPNPELLVLPYLRAEAVLSSKIEGTVSTISDLLFVQAQETRTPGADMLEVLNYLDAMKHGLQRLRAGFPLCLRLVKELQQVLLSGVRGETKKIGDFRDEQNWIGPPGCLIEDATFVPPPVDVMREALADWETFLHHEDMPLLIQLALVHYQFEVTHPFFDGNGRIGRLLVSLMLVERKALTEPLLYLSAYFERRRTAYYRHLLQVSQSGDLLPWIEFFLDGVISQARDAEERTVRLVESQKDLRDKLMHTQAPTSVLLLAENLLVNPYVTSNSTMKLIGGTRPTAQKAIDTLVDLGVLQEMTGQKRNRVYFAMDIYNVIYGDLERPDPPEGTVESTQQAGDEAAV